MGNFHANAKYFNHFIAQQFWAIIECMKEDGWMSKWNTFVMIQR
jgi:hypothetical protein